MARHDSPHTPTGRRVLVALATAGVALGAGAGAAAAAAGPVPDASRVHPGALGPVDPQAGLNGLLGSVRYVTGPLAGLKPNPLAGTGADPLDNGVATRLADFRPLSSKALTGPIAQAQSIGGIPVLGQATGLLGG
ncbi:hypothetical protein ACWC24_31175 [Streptomyces sp. NPDC001443]